MCFTSHLEEEKVLCEYPRRQKVCFTSHKLEVVNESGELGSGEFGSGDFGSGDIGSGEFDQLGISQVLRLTSLKIPGGIWSVN